MPAVPLSLPGPSAAGKVLEARVGGGVWPGRPPYPYRDTCLRQSCRITKRSPAPCSLPETLRPRGGGRGSFQEPGARTAGPHVAGQAPRGQVSRKRARAPPGPEQRAEELKEQQMAWCPAAAAAPALASPDCGLDPPGPWSRWKAGRGAGVKAKLGGQGQGSQGCPTPDPRPPGQRTWGPG